jgi:hypothetical protein
MSPKGKIVGARKTVKKGTAAIDGTKAHCVWPVVTGKETASRTRKQLELDRQRKGVKKPR